MGTEGREPLPPGRRGLPYLGETLALQRNAFDFLDSRRRRHGNVFRSRILGRDVAVLAGTEGAEAFYREGNITRTDAHPFPLVDLFGGVNFEMYDGPRHFALKSIMLTAFDRDSMASYLDEMQGLIESKLAAWAARGEVSGTAELRRLAIECICLNVMGLPPGPRTDAITRDYAIVLKGLVSVPVALPASAYKRGRAARDRLLATIRAIVAERRASPAGDGLSRILAARAPDGRRCTDDEAVLEVHHMVIAGFIVYALMAEVMRRLPELPDIAERCTAEVDELVPAGSLTLDALARLRTSTLVVLESKRLTPVMPLAFGRADRAFSCAGYRIPKGWTVYLGIGLCSTDPAVWQDPGRFDPDRFGPERADSRHRMAFIPQGYGPATGHLCLGLEYSTVLVLAFLALLVRGYQWELPPQDLAFRWSTIPPEHRDGLRIRLRARQDT